MNEMTTDESIRLIKLEKIITFHKEGFIKTGSALEEIRDNKLYRKKYGTFDEYCLKKWGWSSNYGKRLIAGARVANTLPIGTVSNESQARALAAVPAPKREETLAKASVSGIPTAKKITAAAVEVEAEVVEVDETGIKVPRQAMAYWKRRGEIKKLLSAISMVKSAVASALEGKDLLYCEVNPALMHDLTNAYGGLKRALPYSVCLKCQGKLTDGCRVCGGRGVVSKHLYDCAIPELKAMRSKLAK